MNSKRIGRRDLHEGADVTRGKLLVIRIPGKCGSDSGSRGKPVKGGKSRMKPGKGVCAVSYLSKQLAFRFLSRGKRRKRYEGEVSYQAQGGSSEPEGTRGGGGGGGARETKIKGLVVGGGGEWWVRRGGGEGQWV